MLEVVPPVQLVHKALQVQMEQLVHKVTLVPQVHKELQVLRVIQAPQALRE